MISKNFGRKFIDFDQFQLQHKLNFIQFWHQLNSNMSKSVIYLLSHQTRAKKIIIS